MPIVSSGQVSLSAIATEFGGSEPHQLSEYHGKGNAPSSGEIQLAADFYGTANTYDIQYLIVGGGGGAAGSSNGNEDGCGAGGAGGYRALTATLTPGSGGMTVTIGAGGGHNGMSSWNAAGVGASNGGNSSFNGNSGSGGGGGGYRRNGNSGGSGGGGGHQRGVSYTNPYSYSGGSGNVGNYTPSEGGDGQGGGQIYHQYSHYNHGHGGHGGELPTSDRTWLNGTVYATGGDVGGFNNGAANTGNGAGSLKGFYATGKTGGTGVVIIRYAGSQKGSGGTVTSSGGYTYHQFNSSGTYTP